MFWEHTALAVLRRAAADGAAAPTPVHRLGVGTSGVLLCAATPAARAALGTALQQRRITKTYRALASGLVQADAFEVDVPIGPVAHASYCGSVHAAVPGGGDGARPALSRVRLLRRDEAMNASLVEVEIPTGRPHQIRIHLAYAGHPLVGDPLYGRLRGRAACRLPCKLTAAAVDDGSGGARPCRRCRATRATCCTRRASWSSSGVARRSSCTRRRRRRSASVRRASGRSRTC